MIRALLLIALLPAAAAGPIDDALDAADGAVADPPNLIDKLIEAPSGGERGRDIGADPGFDEAVSQGIQASIVAASVLGAVAALGFGIFLVSRYISPKEALKNPQRAMLYGFIRATPGAHLKQLSEEFGMKSSSILWHIRKLEGADMVRSERANGYRVFFPVAGGLEVRRVSRAMTALQNRNARNAFSIVDACPGSGTAEISSRTHIHPGTVRWHMRKLLDFGLVEEVSSGQKARFFPTPLGTQALEGLEGAKVPSGTSSPLGAAQA